MQTCYHLPKSNFNKQAMTTFGDCLIRPVQIVGGGDGGPESAHGPQFGNPWCKGWIFRGNVNIYITCPLSLSYFLFSDSFMQVKLCETYCQATVLIKIYTCGTQKSFPLSGFVRCPPNRGHSLRNTYKKTYIQSMSKLFVRPN